VSQRLNREAYEKLIEEDIEWLKAASTRTLERDHVVAVLLDSVRWHYEVLPASDAAVGDLRFALRGLRHLYEQMLNGCVVDTAEAARGLLGPAIRLIEKIADTLPRIPPNEG
jgi:hypothetical protein